MKSRANPHGPGRRRVVVASIVVAVALAACSSTQSATTTTSGTPSSKPGSGSVSSSEPPIPASAFTDTTGITAKTVSIGNVSTLTAGLFEGAAVGTEAYADYINARGGVNGRTVVVDSGDDQYSGATNKTVTQADVQKDFAMVGSFSVFDSFGGTVLAANPQVPSVSVSLDTATNALPNSFSPAPAAGGWPTGPLLYFKKKYPAAIRHTAALVADPPSAVSKWLGEKAAMASLGYKVVYDPEFDITQKDFNQNVIAMRNAGVKILFLEQMPENYAAAVIQALNQQDFHPVVVLGGSTYSRKLVSDSGGASAIDGTYLEQNAALYLGEDSAAIPAVKTFLAWVQKTKPGFAADLYTLYGWLSAELFVQALQAAGPDPTRGSVLQQLRKITGFSGGYLTGPSNPAKKLPTDCFIIARITGGNIVRLDDPPVSGPTHGYNCKDPYYFANTTG